MIDGASLSADTVIVTESVSEPPLPSVTVTVNTSVYSDVACGAVKVGEAAEASLRDIVVPLSCDQAYVSESLSSSLDPLASRVTVSPSVGVWSLPALADGASFTLETVRVKVSVTVSVPVPSSVAVTTTVYEPMSACSGVPESVPAPLIARLPDDGRPLAVNVSVSLSASAKFPDTSKLYAESSSIVASEISDDTVGASFTSTTVTVIVIVSVLESSEACNITVHVLESSPEPHPGASKLGALENVRAPVSLFTVNKSLSVPPDTG